MSEPVPPHGSIAHFAINADDLDASKTFYRTLFGWSFHPWGPPGFYLIERPQATNLRAALQGRRALLDGVKTVGFECTVAVDDVHATIAKALELGGKVIVEPVTIPTVCELAFLEDPSGNVLGIAKY